MSKINIAFGVTNDWINYTFVTICSILSNSNKSNNYKFYIMSDIKEDEFYQSFNEIIQKLNNIQPSEYVYIKINNSDFADVVHDKRVGISAYYRLKLSSLVKEDKIIYLDSDLIVLDDIANLWDYDIKNYLLAGVEDKYSDIMKDKSELYKDEIYINSGVLLINLERFQENNIENLIFQKLKEENNDYSDQDVLNNICKGQILYLPLKYNLMLTCNDNMAFPTRKDEYEQSLKNPMILHYSIKPWILPVQYSEYWRKYAEKIQSL